jgi:putative long chain acyl-CoA synthase
VNERRKRSGLGKAWRRLRAGANNAKEIVRYGRLTDPHRTPFDVVHQDRVYSVRRYRGIEQTAGRPPLLLVPPLMVTSEIYDMSPELSAVSYLLGREVDVYLIDFGAPEQIEGGMKRTLDDHVSAVSNTIARLRDLTGRDVHLGGYSQGGMFCYQAAAYRRSESVASIITFGSPVDIYRNLPLGFSEKAAEQIIAGLRRAIERPLAHMDGLPGILTSVGFKLVSPKKELAQLGDFVAKLHDREALEKREVRRRFLGGEGFVAWPGPALRTFVDEYIVANRMASGGFVIDGRTVSLADITCPILCFVGLSDDIARPASVRAVKEAAFNAEVFEVGVKSGHLGLVVGGRAMSVSWPTVAEFIAWRSDRGSKPAILEEAPPIEDVDDEAFDDLDLDLDDVVSFATGSVGGIVSEARRAGAQLTTGFDVMRYQVPRLTYLRRLKADTRVSLGRTLAHSAAKTPERTFFLWKGRAFSYRDADRRVDAVVRGLISQGVRPGQRVGVLMEQRPTYLSVVGALSRLGAVAVLLGPKTTRVTITRALELGEVEFLVTDPANAAVARDVYRGPVLALGGPYTERSLPDGVVDLEAIDVDGVSLPAWYVPNPGTAKDLAYVLFTAGRGEEPRAAKVTNRRWAFSAYGGAAGATLHGSDTVYCALPLHHAAGILVSVGSALVGGSRLALAPHFSIEHFWPEVRRYGATVVFYAGDMCRALVDMPPQESDGHNPVRLFAGSGMRVDVWERLRTRYNVNVLEFYAATEGNAVLANAAAKKVGSLGRALPGATQMALVRYDFDKREIVRDPTGHCRRVRYDEAGLLLARVDAGHPLAGFDGYLDASATEGRLVHDAFERGDSWFITNDLLRQDVDGDYWFVDRVDDVVVTSNGPVFTYQVEDMLYRHPDVRRVAVYGVGDGKDTTLVAAIEPRGDLDLGALRTFVEERLERHQRPSLVRIVDAMPITEGYRVLKTRLRALGREGCVPLEVQRVVETSPRTV